MKGKNKMKMNGKINLTRLNRSSNSNSSNNNKKIKTQVLKK